MITYVVGDIFRSPAHVLVNTVNTVGVMGKGIAKTFKRAYPEMFKQYRHYCETGALTVGKLWIYKTPNKWILNFPTKTTWRKPSRLEYIDKGLQAFVRAYAERGITSIAFPALGCGNGGLDWENQVRPLMEKYLNRLPIDIFIYVYGKNNGTPEHENIKTTAEWLRQEPESLGFHEVWKDLKELVDSGIQLKSFYEEEAFSVKSLGDDGIEICTGEKKEIMYYDELLDFWNVLRSYGFGLPSIMPAGVSPYKSYLLALFAKLPYCNNVLATKHYKLLNDSEARGIQYIPRPDRNHGLFNGTPKRFAAV